MTGPWYQLAYVGDHETDGSTFPVDPLDSIALLDCGIGGSVNGVGLVEFTQLRLLVVIALSGGGAQNALNLAIPEIATGFIPLTILLGIQANVIFGIVQLDYVVGLPHALLVGVVGARNCPLQKVAFDPVGFQLADSGLKCIYIGDADSVDRSCVAHFITPCDWVVLMN